MDTGTFYLIFLPIVIALYAATYYFEQKAKKLREKLRDQEDAELAKFIINEMNDRK